jgi:hypothetical protein
MKRIALSCAALLLLPSLLAAGDFDKRFDVRFLKISGQEQAVVIKTPDGRIQLLHVGDNVDSECTITAIEEGMATIEGPGQWAPLKYLVRLQEGKTLVTTMARRPIEKHVSIGRGNRDTQTVPSR